MSGDRTPPRRARRATTLLLGLLLAVGAGCTPSVDTVPGMRFVERSKEAGLDSFLHTDGSSGNYLITETIASGVALFDYDDDGDLDVYFPNGRPLPPTEAGNASTRNALFRNEGGLRFTDVTEQTGVGGKGFAVGCCAADYDNDGDLDLYVAGFGSNVLYRNEGPSSGWRFRDVTDEAGVDDARFSADACFTDIDSDGHLDLYVSNYVVEVFEGAKPCIYNGVRGYCAPGQYVPVTDSLFRNRGDGTFEDVSESSGIRKPRARWGLSVISSDFDLDGHLDIYVANDRTDNFLFINQGDGTFEERGLDYGMSVSANGDEQGSMGVGLGDYDNDGDLDLIVTNYQKQLNALYELDGMDGASDRALGAGIGEFCLPLVSWGTGFYDLDLDGWRDLFIATGHLEDNISAYDQSSTYLQQNQLFRNEPGPQGRGRVFRELGGRAGPALEEWKSSRGAGFGDLDGDGDIDIVVNNSRDRPSLLVNEAEPRGSWVMLDLRRPERNRFALGARVRLVAGGLTQSGEVRSSGSYAGQNDLRLHFGLGAAKKVDRLEIRWPDGAEQVIEDLPAGRVHRIEQAPSKG